MILTNTSTSHEHGLCYFILSLALVGLIFSSGRAEMEDNSCVVCHQGLEDELLEPVNQWRGSVHGGSSVYCQDCHGGDPGIPDEKAMGTEDYIGVPEPTEIPALCAKCHADPRRMRKYNLRIDQLELYKTSIHGKVLLEKGDTRAASCTGCHGTHDIRKRDDPNSSVYHTKVPETCGKCHSDPEFMEPYDIPTDQLELYKESYHGKILYGQIEGKNPLLVPNCADCHGIHGATPPGVSEIADVCGNCHANTARYFEEGPHYGALMETGAPKCVDCHGNHKNVFPGIEMFSGEVEGHCGSCHDRDSREYQRGQEIAALLDEADRKAREAEMSIEEIKHRGRNISDLEDLLDNAKTNFTEALPVAHNLSLKSLKERTGETTKSSAEVLRIVDEFKRELSRRKRNSLLVIFLILVIVGLMYTKRRSLH